MAQYNTPQALRPLEKLICDFAYSNGYEPMSVFNDFLRYVTHGFSPGAPPVKDWKYKRQQNRFFMELFAGWIQLMQRELQTREWFDAFGDLFMALSSRSGQQAHGQFFTPVHICDLMVQCTGTDEKTTGKRMNDPTCGSGRLLLAYHVRNLGNYLVAEDISRTCCLMTVCNMLIHGCVGEVIQHDSLLPRGLQGRMVRESCPDDDRHSHHPENERGRIPDKPEHPPFRPETAYGTIPKAEGCPGIPSHMFNF